MLKLYLFVPMALAMLEIFILGFVGFSLVKTKSLSSEGLNTISDLAINLFLPLFIFSRMLKGFNFQTLPYWWIFPLIAIAISLVGFIVGIIIVKARSKITNKREFISLVAFQNSGYLPLVLLSLILKGPDMEKMFILIFLSLIGFNLIMFSLGVVFLVDRSLNAFKLKHFFNPPVVASLASFIFVLTGINKFVPDFIFRPINMLGDCTLPLSMLVVGGSLAHVKLENLRSGSLFYVILAKLIIMPSLALWVALSFNMPFFVKLLIVLQAAMPSATTLSVISAHYRLKEQLISRGILITHLAGLITIPLFLSLFFILVMVK